MSCQITNKLILYLLCWIFPILMLSTYTCPYWTKAFRGNTDDTKGLVKLSTKNDPSHFHLNWSVVSAPHNMGTIPPSLLWFHISNDTILWHVAHYEHRYFPYKSPGTLLLMFFHYHLAPLPSLYIKQYTTISSGNEWEKGCIKGEWISFGHIVDMKGEVDYLYMAIFKLGDNSIIPNYIDLFNNDSACTGAPIVRDITVYYKHNETQIDFATCLYRGIAPDKTIIAPDIASWLELNRAMGIQHVTMYDQSLNTDLLKMLSKYRQEGFVDLIDWKLHYQGLRIANCGQVATIQDCFYRYLRRAKYVLFIDLDELIVPHKNATIPQMIEFINNEHSDITQYQFYNSFWHNVGKPVLGADNYSLSMGTLPVHFRRTNRTSDCPSTIRYKNIVKVETAVRVGIHHVYKMKAGERVYKVPEDIGLMHHYRTPDYAYEEEQVEDMVMSKYVHQVMTRLK